MFLLAMKKMKFFRFMLEELTTEITEKAQSTQRIEK